MIAIFRIRFDTNSDSTTVWSDDKFNNYMTVGIPYSLANFWWESGWGNFDLGYNLFPAIVVPDPDPNSALPVDRGVLVDGTVAEIIKQLKPKWEDFDIIFLWFAQRTDLFGGGTKMVTLQDGSTKTLNVTVADSDSRFDGVCQELGHSFGLQHEITVAGGEYASPYSVMSAMDERVEFERAADSRLPDGIQMPATDVQRFIGKFSQRIIGPSLPTVQLYRFPWFTNSPFVLELPDCLVSRTAAKIFALDYSRQRSQTTPLTALVIIPSDKPGFPYFSIELRRGGGIYDKGIGTASGPKAGLTIYSFRGTDRPVYLDVLPVSSKANAATYHCAEGDFTLKVSAVDPNLDFVEFVAYRTWLQPMLIKMFPGDNGVMYALMDNGDLMWYRHDGRNDGSFRWANNHGKKVGVGWNVKHIFYGGDGIIYAINNNNDLLWFHHDGENDRSFRWTDSNPRKVGTGWNMKRVFSGDNGVIYAINFNDELLWFRHDGRADGSFRWADNKARKVGNGWGMKQVFSGHDGVIYAINDNDDLLWFRHDGRNDGSFKWADNNARKVGTGWNMKNVFSGSDGVIYGISENSELLWFRHDGRNNGSFLWADNKARKVGIGWHISHVIYAVTAAGDLMWFRHDGRSNGSFSWGFDEGMKIGVGWKMKHVFSGGNGVIYAINANDDLLWFRHDGRWDGSFRWTDNNARKVGAGWNMKHVFSGGDGVIYAINGNNDLLWFRHEGRSNGSFNWADNNARKVGAGWNFEQVLGD